MKNTKEDGPIIENKFKKFNSLTVAPDTDLGKTFMVIIKKSDFNQVNNGNSCLNSIESLIDEIFKTDDSIRIEGEERVYHKQECDELIKHIQEALK